MSISSICFTQLPEFSQMHGEKDICNIGIIRGIDFTIAHRNYSTTVMLQFLTVDYS